MKFSRRRILKNTGTVILAHPFMEFLKIIESATAAAQTNAAGKRYVYIQQDGAPARWMFDLLLNPDNTRPFSPSPHMGTQFKAQNGRYTEVEYKLENINGLWVPPIWNLGLPTFNRGPAKLADLMNHMLHIRGINTENSSHPFCQRLHMHSVGTQVSNTALVAGSGNSPIPAININTRQYSFASRNSMVAVNLGSSANLIQELMEPFILSDSIKMTDFGRNLERYSKEISEVRAAINSQLASKNGFEALKDSALRSEALMKRNFPNLEEEWVRLHSKYETLVQQSLQLTIPGINDLPIGTVSSRTNDPRYNLANKTVTNADIRELIQPTTTVSQLASRFAAIEFILTNDISRSIAGSIGGLINLNSSAQTTQNIDEHRNGSMISLYLNTLLYTCISSCLYELIWVLKEKGIFVDTVIDIGGEFNRSPRSDGSGSDHGFTAKSVMLFTGQIQNKPLIFGEIQARTAGKYTGEWGESAVMKALGGYSMSQNNFAATLATLLNVPSPVNGSIALIRKDERGSILPKIPTII